MTELVEKIIWNDELWKEAQGRDGLKELRARSWKKFEQTGFPTLKEESWRYTSTAFVSSNRFHFAPLPRPDARTLEHLRSRLEVFKSSARIVFLDGWFMPQVSNLKPIEDGINFASMRDLALDRPQLLATHFKETGGFSAMNAALFQDGFWLHVHSGAKLATPLLIYFLQTSSAPFQTTQLRHSLSLGDASCLKIVEWHDCLDHPQIFFQQEVGIHLAKSSQLEHFRLQGSGSETWMRSATEVALEQKSRYERLDFEAGSRVSRNEIRADFLGGESVCILKGIGLGSQSQHLDTQVVVNHAVPGGTSDQVYRNLLSGNARGVFGGCVRVHPDAQKTDAQQVHKTLLLSSEARADTKPQLQIDADDVKCSHGAAIGQLDEDSLFYLRSRGISLANAEKILAAGFLEKVLDGLADETMRIFLKDHLKAQVANLF